MLTFDFVENRENLLQETNMPWLEFEAKNQKREIQRKFLE